MARRLTELVHDELARTLRPGDHCVDATAGNGHDTLVLSRLVGASGRVYAFDVQESALAATADRLNEAHCTNVILIRDCHSTLHRHVADPIAAATFNLGYRPGGDHALTTRIDSTIPALQAACDLLKSGGLISVLAYVGHPGGCEEALAVEQFCRELDTNRFSIDRPVPACDPQPRLTWIRRRDFP